MRGRPGRAGGEHDFRQPAPHRPAERESPSGGPLGRFAAEAPSPSWQMDFDAYCPLDARADGRGERYVSLTVSDDHSRYLLGALACASETAATGRERLERVFED